MSRKKKIVEIQGEMDVSFQDGPGTTGTPMTKRVKAVNPADAMRQAMQGQNPQGAITITPADPMPGTTNNNPPTNPMPGGALSPPGPGLPQLRTEGLEFPQRITLPSSFVGLVDEIVERVDGARMVSNGGRPTVILQNASIYESAIRVISRSKNKNAKTVLEGIMKVRTR